MLKLFLGFVLVVILEIYQTRVFLQRGNQNHNNKELFSLIRKNPEMKFVTKDEE